ncbi:hypothetical protein ACXWOM_09695, partial [Streptococcus pyogenes]
ARMRPPAVCQSVPMKGWLLPAEGGSGQGQHNSVLFLQSGAICPNNARSRTQCFEEEVCMSYNVTVVFGAEREYEFSLHESEVAAVTK